MSRFILIDHSIIDFSGHHYEYALRILEAAQKQGFEVVLATNHKLRVKSQPEWQVYPIYHYGFWVRSRDPLLYRTYLKLRGWAGRTRFRLMNAVVYSPVGLLWMKRSQPGDVIRSAASVSPASLALLLIIYLLKVAGAFFSFLRQAFPFSGYFKRLWQALRALFGVMLRPFLLLLRPPRWLAEKLADQRKLFSFAADTEKLFRKLPLEEGDVVFIPTLAEAEMMGLLRYFRRDAAARRATWHLLFRRNIYTGRDPDYSRQEEDLRPLKNAFRLFRQQLDGQPVYFYTDTDQLTDQYNRLGAGHFETLPVPVSDEYAPTAYDKTQALNILYIGDARTEKGYHHLPRLVQDLWHDAVAPGRVRFCLQSNFNVAQGEPPSVVGRAQLATYAPEQVRLLMQSLSTAEYRDFVLSGDIIPILYDGERYYARSSGIFIEALSAGKPVIVPAGSWMALELSTAMRAYHERLLQTVEVVEARRGRYLLSSLSGVRLQQEDMGHDLLLPGSARRCLVQVPPVEATYMLISFEMGSQDAGKFVQLTFEQLDAAQARLSVMRQTVGRAGATVSVLFPLNGEATQCKLWLKNAFSPDPLVLMDLRCDYLRADAGLPLNAVGMTYASEDDICACAREIIAHYAHYRQSAHDFAAQIKAFYTPDVLVSLLAEKAQ